MYPEWRNFKTLTGKPTEKRFLGRPKRIWEDNIRMYLKEIKKQVSTRGMGFIRLRIEIIGEPL